MQAFCRRASLVLVALLTACDRSGPTSPGGTTPEPSSRRSSSDWNGPVEILTPSGIEMVSLPGGEFLMGRDQGNPDEAPAHKVKVSPFLIDKFEVTHAMFTKAQLPNPS